jgi:hypothetical protein
MKAQIITQNQLQPDLFFKPEYRNSIFALYQATNRIDIAEQIAKWRT